MHETILRADRIFSGKVVTLDILQVELPDGQQVVREVIQHSGAVAVVPLDASGQVILVRQFRSAARQSYIELPAGIRNPGEDPVECAAREMQEETGYRPGKLEPLGGLFTAPGYTTEYIHLFLATDLTESRLPGDVDEFIEVVRLPLDEALARIDRGEIQDAKTIIGLLRLARQQGAILP
jgi:ADP-ribose pyrophosphatase